jgi:hypothetical protein
MIYEQVIKYMYDVCALPATKIFHNAQYDVVGCVVWVLLLMERL